jgi:hypothetical protein
LTRFVALGAVLACVLGGQLGAASQATGATRYAEVEGDGPPSGPAACPIENPCALEPAVEDPSVADGDEVIVMPGTYDLGANNLLIDDSLTVRGQGPGQRPLITGSATGSNALVEVSGGPDLPAPPSQLLDLDISSSSTNSLLLTRAVANRLNVIHNGGFLSVACQLGFESRINDSVCAASNQGGIGLLFSIFGGNLSYDVRNVTAYSAQAEAIFVFSGSGSHTLNIKNTIATGVTDVKVGAAAAGTATLNAADSNYSTTIEDGDGTTTITAPGTAGNQTAEPALVSPAAGDFHQVLGSPTINGGDDAQGVAAFDLDGMPRFQGPAPDIGAHEYDLIAPETTITKQPKPKTESVRATLKFSSDEQGSGFRCKVDQKPYRNCSSPLKLNRLKPGRHKVLVKAVDGSGNEDPTPSVARWKVRRP